MPAIFTVNPRSGIPLYVQLIEQIKRCIAVGILRPGERLPTVKQLAVELTINSNTVARAYRELERDAIVDLTQGRGSFVRDDGTSSTRAAADALGSDIFDDAVREAKALGLSGEQMSVLFSAALRRWFPKEQRIP